MTIEKEEKKKFRLFFCLFPESGWMKRNTSGEYIAIGVIPVFFVPNSFFFFSFFFFAIPPKGYFAPKTTSGIALNLIPCSFWRRSLPVFLNLLAPLRHGGGTIGQGGSPSQGCRDRRGVRKLGRYRRAGLLRAPL